MNAPEAHYVANADAKVQLFSLTTITFHHFFQNSPLHHAKPVSFSNIRVQRVHKHPFSRYFFVTLQSLATARQQRIDAPYFKQRK